MKLEPLLKTLIEYGEQLRVYHWQTTGYAEHKALGDLYDAVTDTADSIAEAGMGGLPGAARPALAGSFKLEDYKPNAARVCVASLAKELSGYVQSDRPDIDNIVQDLLATVNKTRYLLTLS